MKLRLLPLIIILLSIQAKAQTLEEAVAYLENISLQFQEISQKRMSYTSAASHGKSVRKVDKKRIDVLNAIQVAEANVRKMKPFNGDFAFRDSVVAYLALNRIVLNKDYGKILTMEEIAERSYDAMETYLLAKEHAVEKLDVAYNKVKEQQSIFAQKNNIKIIEKTNSHSQKIESAGKVFQYYDQIYLIFFKCHKNEAYLMDAINRKDINAMEQTKNALMQSVTEGFEKIDPIVAFKGDTSLKVAGQQLLNFYKMEASQKIPEIINFYLKKEIFEKIKTAFEANRNKTAADIEDFNKASNEFNASIEKVNAVLNELRKKGEPALSQWNNSSQKFLDTHIPKHNG